MRKAGIAVLILAVLVVAAALILPHVIDVNQYHNQIQTELAKKLGRNVSLGQMHLGLLPPSFEVDNAILGEDNSFPTGRPFAAAEKLVVSVRLLPLLHKEVDVRSVRLERPRIELVRDAKGQWNFASLGQVSKPEAAQPATTPAPPAKSSSEQFALGSLVINDGQVAVTDEQKRKPRAVYDHIDLTVNDFAPNQEFAIKAAAHLPGEGKQLLALEGKGGPIQPSDPAGTNFSGTLSLDQVSLASAAQFLNSPATSGMDAQVSGSAKVQSASGKIASSGSMKFDDPHIHNVRIGYPVTIDYDVADDLTNDVIEIHRGDLKLGTAPVGFSGTVNAKDTPARIDLKLTAADATLAQAARLASAFGVAFGQGTDVNGRVNADIHASGAATSPALNGHLSLRDLVISGKELAEPVKASDVELTLTPQSITSNNFTASTGATTVTASLELAQYTTPNSVINAALRLPSAKIAEVLNIAKAYGVSAVEGMTGDGMLALDVRVQGPVKNLSALAFNGSGSVKNATLKMPTLTQPVAIRNADLGFSQNSATLKNLSAGVGQTNATGTLTLKNFAAPQVQFTLSADKVNVTELQQLVAAQPAKRAGNRDWSLLPSANAEPAGQPSILDKMTGGGKVDVGTVQYDDLTLTNLRTNVSLNNGLIQLNPVTANLYGGTESGTITLDMRPAQPVYAVNMKTDKVDANKLLSSVSSVKQTLYGALASNVNASFSAPTSDAIARGLNGTLALNLSNGKLVGLDMLHELSTVGKFLGLAHTSQGFTNVAQLSGNFDVQNGVAQTNNLKAVIDGGTLAGVGLVDLGKQTLNMHVTAVLNKALSQQVGGNQVGGFMNTALANNQGELVLPVIVTGTLQHPQVEPDVKMIAQMRLQNLLPTSKNPGALTDNLLGAVTGKQGGANGQQKGLGGILNSLGGRKQQNQQTGNQPGNQQQPASTGTPQPQQNSVVDLLNQM
ncbi:MAG TPA: AsmA family protein, partial [Candidatus Angelobacter sp.]|nr:AsmA family protein [Candidatus Angelobacter sp.]